VASFRHEADNLLYFWTLSDRDAVCVNDKIDKHKHLKIGIGVALLVLLVLIVWLFTLYPLADMVDHDAVASLITQHGVAGVLGFIVVGALATAVGLPRQLVAFIGGYAFGIFTGVLLATLAAAGGCFLCFSFSRRWLRKAVTRRFAGSVDLLNRLIRTEPFLKIIVLRLQPFGTNLTTNLAAGVTEIPLLVFLGSSILGNIPQLLVFSITGSGVRMQSYTQMIVSAILFCVSVLLGVYLYRRHVAREASLTDASHAASE